MLCMCRQTDVADLKLLDLTLLKMCCAQPISRSQPVQPATPDPLGQVSTGGLGGVSGTRDASGNLDSLLDEIGSPVQPAM